MRLKSAKNRFQLSAGLNLETLNTILSETNHIWTVSQIKPRLKFFKFGLWFFLSLFKATFSAFYIKSVSVCNNARFAFIFCPLQKIFPVLLLIVYFTAFLSFLAHFSLCRVEMFSAQSWHSEFSCLYINMFITCYLNLYAYSSKLELLTFLRTENAVHLFKPGCK